MFMPQSPGLEGQQLDEKTLDEMLGISTIPEEQKALERQIRMAQLLGKGAMEYNPKAGGRGTKGAVGGFANALAQGLQGYAYGTKNAANETTERDIMGRQRTARGNYIRARYGAQPGGGGAGAATPSPYVDAGDPEVSSLPPDEEQYPYFPDEEY